MIFCGAVQHSAEPSRMVWTANHYDGAKPVPLAPLGKRRAFVLSSRYMRWDLFDSGYAKCVQLLSGALGRVFMLYATSHELPVYDSVRELYENRHPRRQPAVNKIGSLEHPATISVHRQHNDIGRIDRLIDNEQTSGCAQHWSSHEIETDAGRPQ